MSKKKKHAKNKASIQNAPLGERLAKHWNLGRWEAFITLYNRNREASAATRWGTLLGDALYNALTRALFVDSSIEDARFAAEQILGERDLGPENEMLRACAALALDYAAVRAGNAIRLTPLPKGIALPEPYQQLRRGIAEIISAKGPANEEGASALVKKMWRQFGAFRPGIGITPYTNFWKTAQELEELMKDSPAAATFTAVRAIAELLREIHRAESRSAGTRDIVEFARSRALGEIAPNQTHPVVIGLWNYLCEAGGERYGPEWASAARALQIHFAAGLDRLKTAFGALEPYKITPMGIEVLWEKFDWTDAERFVLLFAEAPRLCDEIAAEHGPEALRRAVRLFERASEIGLRWRPERPWPEAVRFAFSQTVRRDGYALAEILTKKHLPYRSMHASDLLFLIINEPALRKPIENALAGHLPLALDEEWAEETAEMLLACEVSAANLRRIARYLSVDAYRSLLAVWVGELVSLSAGTAFDGSQLSLSPWSDLTDEHFAVICENLPPDSPAGCFCRLCLGAARFEISDDPALWEAFFSSLRDAESAFGLDFFTLFISWHDVPLGFLLRLADVAIIPGIHHIDIDYWMDLVRLIAERKDAASIATKLVSHLEDIPKRDRRKYSQILSPLRALAAGRKPQIKRRAPIFDLAGFDAEALEKLRQVFSKLNDDEELPF